MFGYVAATFLFASCLGQVPHKHANRGHGAGNFGDGALHGGFGGGAGQLNSFARQKEFEEASFNGPRNVGGFRDFGNGDLHGGLLARDTSELAGKSLHGIASAARPKSIGDGKFKSPKSEIGLAFAHVSQTFGSPRDFKEISVHDRALHDRISASGTAEFGKGVVHGGLNGRDIAHNRFLPSDGLRSFENEGFQSGGFNNLNRALNVQKELEHNRPGHGNGGRRGFVGGPIQDFQQFEGVSSHRQYFAPGNFEGFSEGAQKVPKFMGTSGPHIGSNNFGSTAKNGEFPLSDPRFGQVPHLGDSSFAFPTRFHGAPGQDHIPLSGHRQLGGQPFHSEATFNRNVGFGGRPTHGGSPINGHNVLDVQGNGINDIHKGSPFRGNLGPKDLPSHDVHLIGVHEGLSRRPILGVPNLDDSSVHEDKFPVHKFGPNGSHENKFGLAASPFDGHQNFEGGLVNRGLVGHHGHLPNDVRKKHVPEIFSEVLPHFSNNGIGGSGIRGSGFGVNDFGGNGFGGHGFEGNAFGGIGIDGNRFPSDSFVGNIVHGNPVSFENAKQNDVKNFGVGTSKDRIVPDSSQEFGGRPIHDQHHLTNSFGPPIHQSSHLSNVNNIHDRFNGFGLGFVHGRPSLNGPNKLQEGLVGSPVSFKNEKRNDIKNFEVETSKDRIVLDSSKEFGGRPPNSFGPLIHHTSHLSNDNNKHDRFNGFGLGFAHGNPSLNGPNKLHEGLVGIGSLQSQESIHNISPFNQAKEFGIGSFQRGPFFGESFHKNIPEFNEKPVHLSPLSPIGANRPVNGQPRHGNLNHREFSDAKQKGLGTEIIHIGSFDSIGLGKRGPTGFDGKLNIHGAGPAEFEKSLPNSGAVFGNQKEFRSETSNIGVPKIIDREVTHKRSHGVGQSLNGGTKSFNNGPPITKSLLGEPTLLGGFQGFSETSSKGVLDIGAKRIKQATGNAGQAILKKVSVAERTNIQSKEPVKSGPLYISHREYANGGLKGIASEKVNIPEKPLNEKLAIRNPKESSRGRLAISG